jgi:hypothetical protein
MSLSRADLPPGLAFTFHEGPDSAEITGTPVQSGAHKFTVSACCFGTDTSGQISRQDYPLLVQ